MLAVSRPIKHQNTIQLSLQLHRSASSVIRTKSARHNPHNEGNPPEDMFLPRAVDTGDECDSGIWRPIDNDQSAANYRRHVAVIVLTNPQRRPAKSRQDSTETDGDDRQGSADDCSILQRRCWCDVYNRRRIIGLRLVEEVEQVLGVCLSDNTQPSHSVVYLRQWRNCQTVEHTQNKRNSSSDWYRHAFPRPCTFRHVACVRW